MKVNTRLRYGLRALARIAQKDGILQKEISEKENIGDKYLDHIITDLKNADIIINIGQKKRAGYKLKKNISDISMAEVFQAFALKDINVPCIENICSENSKCNISEFWNDFNTYINSYLENLSLKDFLKKYCLNE